MDRKILIIVENLPVPFDTRVWQEATTLAANGYTVSVICPPSIRTVIPRLIPMIKPTPIKSAAPATKASAVSTSPRP